MILHILRWLPARRISAQLAALQAKFPDESHTALYSVAACMFVAALFRPVLRTLCFTLGVIYTYALNFDRVTSVHVFLELFLYGCGAIAFLWCVLAAACELWFCARKSASRDTFSIPCLERCVVCTDAHCIALQNKSI